MKQLKTDLKLIIDKVDDETLLNHVYEFFQQLGYTFEVKHEDWQVKYIVSDYKDEE